MSNLIIAIALWCNGAYTRDANDGLHYGNAPINHCRKELFVCTNKNPNGTGFIQCFKNKEIGG